MCCIGFQILMWWGVWGFRARKPLKGWGLPNNGRVNQPLKGRGNQSLKGRGNQSLKGRGNQSLKGRGNQPLKGRGNQPLKGRGNPAPTGVIQIFVPTLGIGGNVLTHYM